MKQWQPSYATPALELSVTLTKQGKARIIFITWSMTEFHEIHEPDESTVQPTLLQMRTEVHNDALHKCPAALRRRDEVVQALCQRVPPHWPLRKSFGQLAVNVLTPAGIHSLRAKPPSDFGVGYAVSQWVSYVCHLSLAVGHVLNFFYQTA